MPHQCIRCGKEYADGSDALLKGCECGARFFFFYREKMPANFMDMNKDERKEVLNEVQEIVKKQENIGEKEAEKPVILDLESIRVLKPGKYEIDIVSLFKRNPVIYKEGEGKYYIDVESTFKLMQKRDDE